MILVVDASVAVKWFVEEDGRADALAVLRCKADVIVPDLFFAEFANVLRKKRHRGEVDAHQASQAISSIGGFIMHVVRCIDLIERAFQWAERVDHSIYDCLYLTCAEAHGTKFVSADAQFVRKLQDHRLDCLVMPLHEAPALLEGPRSKVKIEDRDVDRILNLHRRFQDTLEHVRGMVEVRSGSFVIVKSGDLRPAFDSLAFRRLMDALNALSIDDLSDLLALAWLGRGYDGDNWEHLRRQSRAMLGGEPSEHFRYVASLLGHVQCGLDKIEAR